MLETIVDIKRWGNSLGVRLPGGVAREAHLRVNQRVRITVEGNQVVIAPLEEASMTLEQRLAAYDPARHGGEQMETSEVLGAERLKLP